jgi:hypothetical protein
MPRPRLATEADYYRLPAPPPARIAPGSFALCPPCLTTGLTPQQTSGMADVYRRAFEQACEAARPSHPEHALFAFWN